MIKLDYNTWFGIHKNLGGIIFDEQYQEGINKETEVRLFIIKENRIGVFSKEVKLQILKPKGNDKNNFNKDIAKYTNAINNIRKTNCYGCGSNINSVSFSICNKCGWIRCTCNSCGCGFKKIND